MNNTYDTKEFDLNELNFLRQNTKLGPVAALKIQKMRSDVDAYRKWYFQKEGELIEGEYSAADALEYELRLRAWENFWAREWKKDPNGLSLSEFANMAMQQQMTMHSGRGR